MHFGAILIIGMQLVIAFLVIRAWYYPVWHSKYGIGVALCFLVPWIPLFLLIVIYYRFFYLDRTYEIYFLLLMSVAFFLSLGNIFRTLWLALTSIQNRTKLVNKGGLLLLWIGLTVSLAVTGIVALFAWAYALISYISGPDGANYIAAVSLGNNKLLFYDSTAFLYFSFVTYFSLGYGDCIPRGWLMLFLVYLEAMLGYINAGILIAYAFNIFLNISKKK